MTPIVDLRSDTVTRPSPAMRRAMYEAEVGDDVFRDDPTVNRLQDRAAQVFDREAALFVPTGSMGNEVALKVHTQHGQDVICEARSHIYCFEVGMMAAFAGLIARSIWAEDGILTWDLIAPQLRTRGDYRSGTGLVELENTSNIAGGSVYPPAVFDDIADHTHAAHHHTVNGQAFTDLDSHLQAHDGRLVLNPLRVSTPQGTLSGALSIDASAEPPVAALNLHAPALSASRVAALLGAPGGASGSVQVDAQLTASGDNEQAMAATLGGHIGLAMVDGTLNDAMFANAIGTALNAAGVPPISGTSTIRCFAGRAKFSHGDGRIDILSLDTSQMSLDGDGTINLADHTLSLHLRPIVRLGGTGVAAPVYVKGHFGDLRAGLDPMLGGRVGFTIGGAGPSGASCASQLAAARGGQAGPAPSMAAPPPPANALETKGNPFRRKPVDLLRRLLPH